MGGAMKPAKAASAIRAAAISPSRSSAAGGGSTGMSLAELRRQKEKVAPPHHPLPTSNQHTSRLFNHPRLTTNHSHASF